MKSPTPRRERKTSLYLQIADKVRDEIRERKLQPHDPVPSEGELAALYGVSRMTTKLALETLEKEHIVYRLARRGTFVAQSLASAEAEIPLMREQKVKKRIAIIFPNLDEYTAKIMASAEAEARKLNYHLLVRISISKEDESNCLQELVDDQINGIILYPRGRKTCSEKILGLNLLKYPLVVIDRIFREVRIDCVYHDHYRGAYNLAKYLIQKGHKRIGYLSMSFDGVTSREDRYKGYVDAMLEHDLSINSQSIFLHCVEEDYMNNLSVSNLQIEKYLSINDEMTAVMCADDYLATSCFYTALHMDKRVPDQLSIAGFSDIQLASLLPVPLTTVRQTTEQLGQAAVDLLHKRIENSREGALTIKVETSIVERSSVRAIQG